MFPSKASKNITLLYNGTTKMRRQIFQFITNKWQNAPKVLKYGVVANTGFSVFLRITADLTQQNIEHKTMLTRLEEYDFLRLRNVAGIGVVLGPIVYYWYKYLDLVYPGKTFGIIGKKILLDQIIGGVAFTFIFIFGLCLMEGQSLKSSLIEFKNKFPAIYLVDWIVWPPVQYLNFYLVPAHYRAAFVSVALFCWNVFLSFMKYYHFNDE